MTEAKIKSAIEYERLAYIMTNLCICQILQEGY